ncbi:hypothetical protein K0M31_010770 [Melipona bicolor]|uniref:Uncharacterized protein n=1 Tax=Melipona bicolor TaxID=60889 RepID=A0AA40FL33_9HYME|nr:hypothetical protein K0M31_010770 [Melipona bicolor]
MSCDEWLFVQASAVHDDVTRRSNNGSFVGTVIDTARSSKSSSMQIFQGVPSGDRAPSVKFVTLDELVHVSKPAIRARRNRAAACLAEARTEKEKQAEPFYWLGLGLGSFVYFGATFDVAEPSLEHEGIIGTKSVAKNKVLTVMLRRGYVFCSVKCSTMQNTLSFE